MRLRSRSICASQARRAGVGGWRRKAVSSPDRRAKLSRNAPSSRARARYRMRDPAARDCTPGRRLTSTQAFGGKRKRPGFRRRMMWEKPRQHRAVASERRTCMRRAASVSPPPRCVTCPVRRHRPAHARRLRAAVSGNRSRRPVSSASSGCRNAWQASSWRPVDATARQSIARVQRCA